MAEFTGEWVIPGEVDIDLFNEHMARYAFAARLARGRFFCDRHFPRGKAGGQAPKVHKCRIGERPAPRRVLDPGPWCGGPGEVLRLAGPLPQL